MQRSCWQNFNSLTEIEVTLDYVRPDHLYMVESLNDVTFHSLDNNQYH